MQVEKISLKHGMILTFLKFFMNIFMQCSYALYAMNYTIKVLILFIV